MKDHDAVTVNKALNLERGDAYHRITAAYTQPITFLQMLQLHRIEKN